MCYLDLNNHKKCCESPLVSTLEAITWIYIWKFQITWQNKFLWKHWTFILFYLCPAKSLQL